MRGFQVFADADPVPGIFVGWGDFLIQLGNAVVIVVMIALFVLALLLPFPHGKRQP